MKAHLCAIAFLLTWAPLLPAQQYQWQSGSTTPAAATQWERDSRLWRNFVNGGSRTPPLRLGRSDLVLGGPLIDTFRQGRNSADRSLGQKILSFPVVNLVVPQRMPSPPDNGVGYLAWRGETRRPWIAAGGGSPAGSGFSPVNNPPQGGLISLSW